MAQYLLDAMHIRSIFSKFNCVMSAQVFHLHSRKPDFISGLLPRRSAIMPTIFAHRVVEHIPTVLCSDLRWFTERIRYLLQRFIKLGPPLKNRCYGGKSAASAARSSLQTVESDSRQVEIRLSILIEIGHCCAQNIRGHSRTR